MGSLLFICYGIEFLLSLAVSVLSTLEVYSISNSLVRGDPDLSHGLQIRRWFMAAIGTSSGVRSLCTILEAFYIYACAIFDTVPTVSLELSFRVIPSLLYFTMYSLLTVYLAQLCYTVNGLPFFHVRNVWFFSNFSLYLLVLVSIVFMESPTYVYCEFCIAHLLNLCAFSWYGISVFKFIPTLASSTSSARLLAPLKKPTNSTSNSPSAVNSYSASNARVLARLLPLIVVGHVGVILSLLTFLLMAFQIATLSSPAATSRDTFMVLAVVASEIIPSIAFLWVLPKQDNSFDEPSLLSLVVRAASCVSAQGYSAIPEDTQQAGAAAAASVTGTESIQYQITAEMEVGKKEQFANV